MKVHAHILPFVVIVFVFLLLGGYIGEKRAHALGQCKVDWMNHPAAHEDKSSGPIKSGDYIMSRATIRRRSKICYSHCSILEAESDNPAFFCGGCQEPLVVTRGAQRGYPGACAGS
jgi:hypothetical protein